MMDSVTFRLLADSMSAFIYRGISETSELDKTVATNISIDTRTLKRGDIYLALKGERFDGHDYVEQAIDNGCSALIVEQRVKNCELPQFVVADTGKALVDAACLNRKEFKGPLIALTGSSGKTSTKNILQAILLSKAKTLATHGNFNNEIGVPLTLLAIGSDDKYAVVEMGARSLGDISYLVSIATPDIAILLNAGYAHIDIFGSYENIVKAKGEIYKGLGEDGVAVVNYDDPAKDTWLAHLGRKEIITFSMDNPEADLFVTNLTTQEQSSVFTLEYKGQQVEISIPLPGKHSVKNALAAAAAALKVGFSLNELIQPLATLSSTEGRLNMLSIAGFNVIDDSYNANPASVKAAVDVLSVQQGRRIAVLAEMAELGEYAEALHKEIAEYVAASPIEKAFFVGRFAEVMAEIAGEKGSACSSKENVVEQLEALAGSQNDEQRITVLIKGSRSTKMEEVCEMLERRAA